MFDLSATLDLPLIWGLLLALAVFLYVVLDGFDLGCGLLFPLAPTDACHSRIMNSIAPFWDGNETWLVLGGGGLLVAFPVAYAILMPALYFPIMLMLLGLLLRGVAFEFRFKAKGLDRRLWNASFCLGSILATFMQGMILGNFVQGVAVIGRQFAGTQWDWFNGYALFTGMALLGAYALLGATWLIMKTHGPTQQWAWSMAKRLWWYVALSLGLVICFMLVMDDQFLVRWQASVSMLYLATALGLSIVLTGLVLLRDLGKKRREVRPFLLTLLLFLSVYVSLGMSMYPWIVPFKWTLWQAAACAASQSIMLVGAVVMLPIVLSYTAYSYFVFRGKSDEKAMY